ncbi:hypothetical protein T06_458 [Trichinella sp. T6]|nr:hypothetical protein T06_458 [Trichinella sp. T6]
MKKAVTYFYAEKIKFLASILVTKTDSESMFIR